MTNVSLTPELERFAEACVQSGRYNSFSDVARAALRLLQEMERTRRAVPRLPPEAEAEGERDGFLTLERSGRPRCGRIDDAVTPDRSMRRHGCSHHVRVANSGKLPSGSPRTIPRWLTHSITAGERAPRKAERSPNAWQTEARSAAQSRHRFWSLRGFPYLLVYDAPCDPTLEFCARCTLLVTCRRPWPISNRSSLTAPPSDFESFPLTPLCSSLA